MIVHSVVTEHVHVCSYCLILQHENEVSTSLFWRPRRFCETTL